MSVCSVQIISLLDSQSKVPDVNTIFRVYQYQYGVSILASVNFCETFRGISNV